MNYKELYQHAYKYMNEKILDEDCGTLCNQHCCRNEIEDGEKIGIYLMPHEYENILRGTRASEKFTFEKHTSKNFYMPPRIKYLYYINCDQSLGCPRDVRPIQCRTYPLEPHLVENKLSLVVEKEQIHQCPLLDRMGDIRKEFIRGIFEGWKLLLQIPEVKLLVAYDSEERVRDQNIEKIFNEENPYLNLLKE